MLAPQFLVAYACDRRNSTIDQCCRWHVRGSRSCSAGAPPRDYIEVESPREAAASRPSEHPDEESSKRQRVEESKRQRVSRLQAEYEQRLCAVRIAYKEYFTMDDYETDLNIEEPMEEDDDWVGEDAVVLTGIPEELWSDAPTDQPAPGIPEKRIDDLADKVEIQRLCSV